MNWLSDKSIPKEVVITKIIEGPVWYNDLVGTVLKIDIERTQQDLKKGEGRWLAVLLESVPESVRKDESFKNSTHFFVRESDCEPISKPKGINIREVI